MVGVLPKGYISFLVMVGLGFIGANCGYLSYNDEKLRLSKPMRTSSDKSSERERQVYVLSGNHECLKAVLQKSMDFDYFYQKKWEKNFFC